MENKNRKEKQAQDNDGQIPNVYNIKKPKDPKFSMENFMEDFKAPDATVEETSNHYFDSYSHFGIHEEMLKDRVNVHKCFLIF